MLKKLIPVALVLALAVCVFAACGGPAETEGPDTDAPETNAPETDAPKCNGEDIHDIEVEEIAATCQTRGHRTETCKVCGEVVAETAYPKTECTPVAEVTCTADSVCSVCGEVIEAATGHTFGEAVVVEATCLAAGSKTQTCTKCGESVVETLPMLAHDIPDANVTASTEATCVSNGSKTGTCTICNQTQTLVLPAAHVPEVDDLSALTIKDGSFGASCAKCGTNLNVTGEVRLSLTFDEIDVATEIAKLATDENGLAYTEVHNQDQTGASVASPAIATYPDAADGHESVLNLPHNRSATVWFNGSLLSDARYYVLSFDMRINAVGNNTRKIGVFGQANKQFDGVGLESAYAYALWIDRSNGVLIASSGEAQFELTAEVGHWYKVEVVVDNAAGEAYTYIDGQFFSSTQSARYQVTEDGVYSWRFGGVYNLFHKPEFDNFTVSAVK